MPGHNTGKTAFTLVEVVIAVVLMLMALGLLLAGFTSSKHSVVLAQTHLIAMKICRDEAERLLTNSYTRIENTNTIFTFDNIQYTMDRSVNDFSNRYKDVVYVIKWLPADTVNLQVMSNYMTICNPD